MNFKTDDRVVHDAHGVGTVQEAGQKHPEWIPVTKRLPKDGEQVLIKGHNGKMLTMFYCEKRFYLHIGEKDYCADDVIAWQPLPEV